MKLTYDLTVDAGYLELVPIAAGAVARTEAVTPWLNLDRDASGHLVGLEILDASQHLPPALLETTDHPRGR